MWQIKTIYKHMKIFNNKYIEELIKQGEHQQLDFKFEITDSKKIARTLAAFANTNGGKLLIGVKDNGTIAGIRSAEEFHMLEAAAQMYCNPSISFEAKEWNVEGKRILEVKIPKRNGEPHKAPNHDGKYMIFIRVDDQNLLANSVLLKVWRKREHKTEIKIEYKEAEKTLLNYLKDHEQITLSRFSRLAVIPRYKAEKILVDFIILDIVKIVFTEKQVYYKLSNNTTNEN